MSWLGETTPDASAAVSGYLIGTAIFGAILLVLVVLQIRARQFHPGALLGHDHRLDHRRHDAGRLCHPLDRAGLHWRVAVAGRARADLARQLENRRGRGFSADRIVSARTEGFYWLTITFSQTLGTALGDWAADPATLGLGYLGGAALFGGLIAIVAALHFWTGISRVALFWAAFILTRPLGATVGDFLDKPIAKGGLNLSRPLASAALLAAMIVIIWWTASRAKGDDRAPAGA